MASPDNADPESGLIAGWLDSTALTTARTTERVGRVVPLDRAMGGGTVGVLVWCAIDRGIWALVPLVVIVLNIGLCPLAVRRGMRPELVTLAGGLFALPAIAVAAAMTGGPSSPLSYLLLIGLVAEAVRNVPRATILITVAAALALLAACLIAVPSTVLDHPLNIASLLVAMACVTMGTTALAGAEIAYRNSSVLDPLTGLLNRAALEDRFEELRQQARLVNASICLVMFDLDHFKSINDQHGHDVGDAILREVAYQVRKSLRQFSLAYRVGGEEFLVVLPGLSPRQAVEMAEQLRATITHVKVTGEISVTASFGVSCAVGEAIDFQTLYRQADQALYTAKRDGRDRVSIREPVTSLRAQAVKSPSPPALGYSASANT